MRLRWPVGAAMHGEPHVRWYSQTAAEFYRLYRVDGEPLPQFASADYRLGDFDATTVGLKLGHTMSRGREWSVRLEYYRQSGNTPDGLLIGNQRETVNVRQISVRSSRCARLYALSGGRFDITSGVLRRAWTFDGGSRVPGTAEIESVRALVGWDKVEWCRPVLRMPAGMEIDFGGVGKEYAVDRAVAHVRNLHDGSVPVNFGGISP